MRQFPLATSQDVSSLTGQVIIDRVRAILDEAAAAFWNDTDMLIWIIDGISDIVSKTWCIAEQEDITLVDAQLEYNITANYIVALAALYTGTKALLPGHPMHVGHTENILEPAYWYEFNNKIGCYPIANSTVAGNTVTIYLVSKPTVITLSTNSVLPAMFDRDLIDYVVATAYLKDGREQTAKGMFDNYNASILGKRADLLTKDTMKASEVKDI
ncbi:hypothetical protein H8E88_24570 [candidate division KSB1 bacterium]|nr:hypothetical protein [candidate division KSB1 bacterium]